ncbi:MAG: endo-1,4-beta-xylanase [Muribaculaceae bacterium]|nr:endo-1,4-beta-xylanase [Muribaculaceae bacterium]
MKQLFCTIVALGAAALAAHADVPTKADTPLKDIFGDKFLIGTALNDFQTHGQDARGAEVAAHHFNSIVAENCMKNEKIHPAKGVYHWDDADALVEFGEKNGMAIIGHCLVWHSQVAPWFFVDDEGKEVSADTLKARMRDHIHTVVGRYKGRIKGWDVVNEAIVENGSYRKSPFYRILGEEFIPLAFQYAHEADPDAELYLNDYGMNVAGRRDTYVKLINDLKSRGLRIDGIGMQGHMGMDYPDFTEFETALEAYANTGVKVMITEWDMSALPTLSRSANVGDMVAFRKAMNPYPDGVPQDVSDEWNSRMDAFFTMFLRHADVIDRVTLWGVSDGDSWKNGFPMRGRKDYPLAFDRDYKMKPFLKKLSEYHKTK